MFSFLFTKCDRSGREQLGMNGCLLFDHPPGIGEQTDPPSISIPMWILLLVFPIDRPRSVRVENNTSNLISLSIGSLQGCVLNLLLLMLLEHDCSAAFPSNYIIK